MLAVVTSLGIARFVRGFFVPIFRTPILGVSYFAFIRTTNIVVHNVEIDVNICKSLTYKQPSECHPDYPLKARSFHSAQKSRQAGTANNIRITRDGNTHEDSIATVAPLPKARLW